MTRLTIESLGAQGDGIANTPSGPVFVPQALPGEEVEAEIVKGRARAVSIVTQAPQRVTPPCKHFHDCGGCVIQHLERSPYEEWKRQKVVQALGSRGLQAEVEPLVSCPAHARRRVALTARKIGNRTLLGYNARQSHHVVDVEECPIARPEIVSALPQLRELAAMLAATPKPFRVAVTVTQTGLDIAVDGAGKVAERARQKALTFSVEQGFARLVLDGEALVERQKPVLAVGKAAVIVPPAGFTQAVAEIEQVMAELVCGHLERSKHAADIFSGLGTFALRLAENGRVHAVEGDAASLAALDAAARQTPSLKPVTVEKRDLFHRPLLAKELDQFDGVVFDPPRAGAEDQCRQLARAKVKRIAAVSCNPGTLARDLAMLVEGGYRITRVVPLDQFLWSPHVEVVALLER